MKVAAPKNVFHSTVEDMINEKQFFFFNVEKQHFTVMSWFHEKIYHKMWKFSWMVFGLQRWAADILLSSAFAGEF